MKTVISILSIVLLMQCSSLAKIKFTSREKAYLGSGHSVIKKNYFITKRSNLNSLMAKQKHRNKYVKKMRSKSGI